MYVCSLGRYDTITLAARLLVGTVSLVSRAVSAASGEREAKGQVEEQVEEQQQKQQQQQRPAHWQASCVGLLHQLPFVRGEACKYPREAGKERSQLLVVVHLHHTVRGRI